jgi:hypothetical protein
MMRGELRQEATMEARIARLATALHKSADELIDEALQAWVIRELSRVDEEILTIAQRYGVHTPDDIHAKIRHGLLEGHPAWEDAMRWENLVQYKDAVLRAYAVPHKDAPPANGATAP